MKKQKKRCSVSRLLMFVSGAALAVVGFIVIPELLEKYSNKIYKSSLKKDKIDFDSMGPEIVQHNKKEGE